MPSGFLILGRALVPDFRLQLVCFDFLFAAGFTVEIFEGRPPIDPKKETLY